MLKYIEFSLQIPNILLGHCEYSARDFWDILALLWMEFIRCWFSFIAQSHYLQRRFFQIDTNSKKKEELQWMYL